MSAHKTKESHAAASMTEAAGEQVKHYVDAGVEAVNAASDRTCEMAGNADKYVHKNPWMAIGVAAGAGVLVGLLLGRRSKS